MDKLGSSLSDMFDQVKLQPQHAKTLGLLVAGFLTGASIIRVVDAYRAWLIMGTGGTPPTPAGYWRITKFGFRRLLLNWNEDLTDASILSADGVSYLKGPLPKREGGRPKIMPWTLPQRQKPEKMDLEVIERLATLMSAIETQHKDILFKAPAKTEGGTGPGLYARDDVATFNPASNKIGREMAHVHGYDNSLHVHLSPADAKNVIESQWGQRFPVSWLAPPSWIMVYAPRTMEEFAVIESIVKAAVAWSTGVEI